MNLNQKIIKIIDIIFEEKELNTEFNDGRIDILVKKIVDGVDIIGDDAKKIIQKLQSEECLEIYDIEELLDDPYILRDYIRPGHIIIKPNYNNLLKYRNKLDPKIIDTSNITETKFKDGILYFKGNKINFNGKQHQMDLLTTLFKNPQKSWDKDEIADDWGETDFIKKDSKVVYHAGRNINEAIAMELQIKDFIIQETTRLTQINKKYIANS